ncbi:MAG TPA: hypothetical protein VHF25_10880 [Nitriliruptorales bacterium]|nr:hypothetical protein [Nitriliruptorales bacterium]
MARPGPQAAPTTPVDVRPDRRGRPAGRQRLPAARIGLLSGTVAILCCAGPTALALAGLMSGAAAYALATELYAGWAWWFRAAGLVVAAALSWWALRRRGICDVEGVKLRGAVWPSCSGSGA